MWRKIINIDLFLTNTQLNILILMFLQMMSVTTLWELLSDNLSSQNEDVKQFLNEVLTIVVRFFLMIYRTVFRIAFILLNELLWKYFFLIKIINKNATFQIPACIPIIRRDAITTVEDTTCYPFLQMGFVLLVQSSVLVR